MADMKQLGDDLQRLWAALDAGLHKGFKRAALAINTAAEDNLRGAKTAPAWSYPVPARTGNLLGSQNYKVEPGLVAYVFNNATYAGAVHSGRMSSWAGRGKHRIIYGDARPFLDDAVKDNPPELPIRTEIGKVIAAWA